MDGTRGRERNDEDIYAFIQYENREVNKKLGGILVIMVTTSDYRLTTIIREFMDAIDYMENVKPNAQWGKAVLVALENVGISGC